MNKKTIIWSVGGVFTAILGYLIYKKINSPQLFGDGITVVDPSSSGSSTRDDLPTQSSGNFPLKKGSRGSEVKKLQTFLNKSNSEKLVVDGIFGRLTEGAVKRNQNPISNFRKSFPKAVYGQVSEGFFKNI